MASVAICTAVSKPKVMSVPLMSLSMVLGTPMTGSPSSDSSSADAQRAVAADHDQRVDAVALDGALAAGQAVAVDVRIHPRGAQNGAAAGEDAAHRVAVEWHGAALHEAFPAIADPEHFGVVDFGRPGGDAADDGIEPGAVAPRGQYANDFGHGCLLSRSRVSRS